MQYRLYNISVHVKCCPVILTSLNSLSTGYAPASNPFPAPAQLDLAVKHIDYHTSLFGYSKPNVEFCKGYIEQLKEAGIEDESQDIVM